jgi:hypothetical protein
MVANDRLLKRIDPHRLLAPVLDWKLLAKRQANRRQLCLCPTGVGAKTKPAKRPQEVHRVARVTKRIPVRHEWRYHVDITQRQWKLRRQQCAADGTQRLGAWDRRRPRRRHAPVSADRAIAGRRHPARPPASPRPPARKPAARRQLARPSQHGARGDYADRRAILAASLRRAFGEEVEFKVAAGGMALWVHFHKSVDFDLWARRSVARGVSWYTGRRYAFDGKPIPFARFSFAWLNEWELPEAVKRLAAARP